MNEECDDFDRISSNNRQKINHIMGHLDFLLSLTSDQIECLQKYYTRKSLTKRKNHGNE